MDGSAKALEILKLLKLKRYLKKKIFKVKEKVELLDGDRKISLEPDETLEIEFQLNYKTR